MLFEVNPDGPVHAYVWFARNVGVRVNVPEPQTLTLLPASMTGGLLTVTVTV